MEVTTINADLEAYQEQRRLFFQAQAQFKAGNIDMGVLCCGYLHAMFGLLPAARYVKSKKNEARAFIDKIDSLRRDITKYKKCKDIPKSGNYLEYGDYEEKIGNKLDDVFLDFLEIMNETGFTL